MTAPRALAILSLLAALAVGGACSAEGDIDSGPDGDGVEIQGDVDAEEE